MNDKHIDNQFDSMKKTRHYNIPIFIPELACPHRCIFCSQDKITGQLKSPEVSEVDSIIKEYLSTIDYENSFVEVAFFGGNFTGIPVKEQVKYLNVVKPYIEKGIIKGIRLSTRPDYINKEILELLKDYNVKTIELGAQSFDEEVLIKSGRGHKVEDTINAAGMIKESGFDLGLQMMIGLPGDTLDKAIFTANKIAELGASNTRIYPAVVIKATKLEEMYFNELYNPLKMDEAVLWSKEIYKIFENNNVTILRVGLHPSEGLLSGDDLIAGPFHISFRELVLTELWNDQFAELKNKSEYNLKIEVPVKEINYAVGYHKKNKLELERYYKSVKIVGNKELAGREFNAVYN
ncbi:MAG: radical SAM protein [Melioribacteraceae bacterium]|nr:radical SAM protein [Melioribacteraceae bacterium]